MRAAGVEGFPIRWVTRGSGRGGTTTMELTAARRPFIYVPLHHHFEQNFHVRQRLAQYCAGRCLDYADTAPDVLAAAMAPIPLSVKTVAARLAN